MCVASEGEKSVAFVRCVLACEADECSGAGAGAGARPVIGGVSVAALAGRRARGLPWTLRLLGWTCEEDCKYLCMHRETAKRAAKGLEPRKFAGKWPFVRVLGMQEVASCVFSLLNALPHVVLLVVYRREAPGDYWMRRPWLLFACVWINAWLWSAAFHARDVPLLERMDYYCSNLGMFASICIAVVRVFEVHRLRHQLGVASVGALALGAHVCYLQLVEFDYGWNMNVAMAAVLTHALLWIGWGFVTRRLYAWKIVVGQILLLSAASLEVYDFPPYMGLFDSHALWHGATPLISFLIARFIVEDTRYELRQRGKTV